MSRGHCNIQRTADSPDRGSTGNTLVTVLLTALVIALVAAAREAAFARHRVPTPPTR